MARRTNAGGPQPNSGRPTGRANLPPERLSPAPATSTAIDATSAPIHTAAALRARGVPFKVIARQLGRDWETVKRWLDSPIGLPILEAAIRSLTDPADLMRHRVPAAASAYDDALEDRSEPALRLRAAEGVLDRVYGKPRIVGDSSSGVQVNVQVNLGLPEPRIIDG